MVQASSLTVLEAGRLVGRSKSHIFRAIKAGTLSAERDDAGSWRIDRAELARVFQLARHGAPDDLMRHGNGAVLAHDDAAVAQLEARFADALDQVRDLRQRLDAEAAERRRLTALLIDRRTDSPPAGVTSTLRPAPARRRWWWRSTPNIRIDPV